MSYSLDFSAVLSKDQLSQQVLLFFLCSSEPPLCAGISDNCLVKAPIYFLPPDTREVLDIKENG